MIEELNELIYVENSVLHAFYSHGESTPFLSQGVVRRRRVRTRQGHTWVRRAQWAMLDDGLHPSCVCRAYWCRTFINSIKVDMGTVMASDVARA